MEKQSDMTVNGDNIVDGPMLTQKHLCFYAIA